MRPDKRERYDRGAMPELEELDDAAAVDRGLAAKMRSATQGQQEKSELQRLAEQVQAFRIDPELLSDAQARDRKETGLGRASNALYSAFSRRPMQQRGEVTRNTQAVQQREAAGDRAQVRLRTGEADARKRALDDPNSSESQRLREFFASTPVGREIAEQIGDAYARVPGSQIPGADELFDMMEKRRQRPTNPLDDELKRARIDALRRPRSPTGNPLADRERELRIAKLEKELSGSGGDGLSKDEEKDVQTLSKRMEGTAAMRGDLEQLSKVVDQEDIPGVSKAYKFVPDFIEDLITSEDGLKVRQSARGIVGAYLKERSGTAASDAEVARTMLELGMGPNASEEQFKTGLRRLSVLMRDVAKTKEAGVRPRALEEARRRGVVTSDDIPNLDAAPARIRIRLPDGSIKRIPPERREEAIEKYGATVIE